MVENFIPAGASGQGVEGGTCGRLELQPSGAHMDISGTAVSMGDWNRIIEEHLTDDEPILNLERGGQGIYDAIFFGGGAAGGFGSASLKALGGGGLVRGRARFLES